jgi:hypothetical protein
VEALRPGTVGDEFKQAGGLAACNPECRRNSRFIKPEQRGCGGGGAQRARGAGRMEAARIGHRRLERGGTGRLESNVEACIAMAM